MESQAEIERQLLRPLSVSENGIYSALSDEAGAPYDSKARIYEWLVARQWYNRLAWGTRPDDYVQFAETACRDGEDNLLDIGCGGLTHTANTYASSGREIWLADNSMAMLGLGRRRLQKISHAVPETIRFLQADAFDLPFPDSSFATICSFGFLHLFDNKEELIEEALRVLKPGGTFYFSALHTGRPFSKSYLQFLYRKSEVGIPLSAREYLSLFNDLPTDLSSYEVGGMVFVRGRK